MEKKAAKFETAMKNTQLRSRAIYLMITFDDTTVGRATDSTSRVRRTTISDTLGTPSAPI
eukprot:1328811-Amorphochlora_amoeboformis.AAC.1